METVSANNQAIVAYLKNITAIEVKSGMHRYSVKSLDDFCREFNVKRKLLVGGQGIPLEEFLSNPAEKWLA